jgi:hypothetical protein
MSIATNLVNHFSLSTHLKSLLFWESTIWATLFISDGLVHVHVFFFPELVEPILNHRLTGSPMNKKRRVWGLKSSGVRSLLKLSKLAQQRGYLHPTSRSSRHWGGYVKLYISPFGAHGRNNLEVHGLLTNLTHAINPPQLFQYCDWALSPTCKWSTVVFGWMALLDRGGGFSGKAILVITCQPAVLRETVHQKDGDCFTLEASWSTFFDLCFMRKTMLKHEEIIMLYELAMYEQSYIARIKQKIQLLHWLFFLLMSDTNAKWQIFIKILHDTALFFCVRQLFFFCLHIYSLCL